MKFRRACPDLGLSHAGRVDVPSWFVANTQQIPNRLESRRFRCQIGERWPAPQTRDWRTLAIRDSVRGCQEHFTGTISRRRHRGLHDGYVAAPGLSCVGTRLLGSRGRPGSPIPIGMNSARYRRTAPTGAGHSAKSSRSGYSRHGPSRVERLSRTRAQPSPSARASSAPEKSRRPPASAARTRSASARLTGASPPARLASSTISPCR